jgi:MFS family permease
MYTASLSAGVSSGIILSGLITLGRSWRYIYFIASAILGAVWILVFLTFPKTAINRSPIDVPGANQAPSTLYKVHADGEDEKNLTQPMKKKRDVMTSL